MTTSPARIDHVSIALIERALARAPACPYFIKNRDLRYESVNDAMLSLCGLADRKDMIGRTVADFFEPHAANRYTEMDRSVLDTGHAVRDHLQLVRPLGATPAWLIFDRWPIVDADNVSVGILATGARFAPDAGEACSRVASTLRLMRANLGAPLCLGKVAQRVRISASQLERDFAKVLGKSPRRAFLETRIAPAQSLLGAGYDVDTVACACGYGSRSALARRFKAVTGMTPHKHGARVAAS